MKKILMAAAGATMLATPALACDSYEIGELGGWAVVSQINDYTYHVMAHRDFINQWEEFSPGLLAAFAVHSVCNMPSGSTYTPPPSSLDPIAAMSGDESSDLYAGYINGYSPDWYHKFD